MGINYSPKIVTDGLVLYLDAANPKSYPGTGTTWYDLSGYGEHGTILTGVTHDSSNKGSFNFNGNDQIITTSFNQILPNMTWDAWIYCNSSVNTYNLFMAQYVPYFAFHSGTKLYFKISIGGTQQYVQTPTNLTLSTWYHAVFSIYFDSTNTTMKIYTNGIETATGTFLGQSGGGGNVFCVGDGRPTPYWYPFNGKVPSVKIYKDRKSVV